jgi:hypothetical protein
MFIKRLNRNFWITKNFRSLKNWYKRDFLSPSPTFIKQKILESHNIYNSVWIETGTYYGETTLFLSKISKKVISIEADKRLFKIAYDKFRLTKNIEIHFGESQKLLNNILFENKSFGNINIFLDAHLCNDHKKNIRTFGTSKKSTPIMLELMIIKKYLKNFKNIKIFIDDIRLFNSNYHNYPGTDIIINWCKKNNLKWKIEQDILIAQN